MNGHIQNHYLHDIKVRVRDGILYRDAQFCLSHSSTRKWETSRFFCLLVKMVKNILAIATFTCAHLPICTQNCWLCKTLAIVVGYFFHHLLPECKAIVRALFFWRKGVVVSWRGYPLDHFDFCSLCCQHSVKFDIVFPAGNTGTILCSNIKLLPNILNCGYRSRIFHILRLKIFLKKWINNEWVDFRVCVVSSLALLCSLQFQLIYIETKKGGNMFSRASRLEAKHNYNSRLFLTSPPKIPWKGCQCKFSTFDFEVNYCLWWGHFYLSRQ